MKCFLLVLTCIFLFVKVFCLTEDGDAEETKTGGGYNHFLSAVVDKNFVEDHLSGKVDWRRSASYSKALAAVPPAQYMKLKKAQHGEDISLYERHFKGKEKGLILESGAFDGYNVSTTLFFEKFAGWSAIHVEADPANYKQLAINRRNSVNVHMALCDEPRILHYVDTGITLAHGIAEFMPDKFLRMHHPKLHKNRTRILDLREIPCFPIKYLLRHLKVTEIDIWVLDTEGSELAVLNGVNFERVKIKVIIMECDGHDWDKDQQKMQFLQQRGYTCSHGHPTCFCKFDKAPTTLESKLTVRKQLPVGAEGNGDVSSGGGKGAGNGGKKRLGLAAEGTGRGGSAGGGKNSANKQQRLQAMQAKRAAIKEKRGRAGMQSVEWLVEG